MKTLIVAVALSFLFVGQASAQIPAPVNPVVFCGTQAAPSATGFLMVFDGGAQEALSMDVAVAPGCPTGTTHSFRVAAARFTLGSHTVKVISVNAVGANAGGPTYTVVIGVTPGPFTITTTVP